MGALLDRLNARRRMEQMNFGIVCCAIGNAAGGKKGNQPFEPGDFFPSLRIAKKPPSPKALHAWADLMNVMQNAKAALAEKPLATP